MLEAFMVVIVSFIATPVFWMLVLLMLVSVWSKRRMPVWRGAWGERAVNKRLAKLDPEYTVYHDLYVPANEYGLTQLDHLVVSPYGLHVIETKHYSGWIFGSERQKYWTQVIYKKKQRMINPVRQNYGHVQAIKSYLQEENLPVSSIIAFSNSAELKFKEPFTTAKVIHFHQLLPTIRESDEQVLSAEQLKYIQSKLTPLVSLNKKEVKSLKREHLRQLKTKRQARSAHTAKKPLATSDQDSTGHRCPKCGGNLITRKGKYGKFLGCDTFPACRYTAGNSE